MEKQHVFSLIVGTIGAFWSAMVGSLGLAVSVLMVVMLADYVTGLLCATVNKELSSSKGTRGFIKKLIVLILIGLVYLLEASSLGTQHAADGAAIAYIAIEFISVTENAGRIGVPLGPLKNIIAILKEKISSKGDEKNG